MSVNIGLLRESFTAIVPHADTVVDHFYQELFNRHPSAREFLAKGDLSRQKLTLVNSLKHIVEFIDDSEHLSDYLQKMGARHVKSGITQEHYSWVAECLLSTFAYFFDSNWTSELNQTWTNTIKAISSEMVRGMEAQAPTPRPEHHLREQAQSLAADVIAKNLATELFKKALEDAFQSETMNQQIRIKVKELIHKVISEEADNILSNYRNTTQNN